MSTRGRHCPSFGSLPPSIPLPSSPSPVGQLRPIVSLAERRGLPSSPSRVSGELSCAALTPPPPPDPPPTLYSPALGPEPRAPLPDVVEGTPERKVACESQEQPTQSGALTGLDRGEQRHSASSQEPALHFNAHSYDKTALAAGENSKGKLGCVVEHSHTNDQQKKAPNASKEMEREGPVGDGLDVPSLGDGEPQRRTVVVRQRVADAIALAARTKLEQGYSSCSVSMSTTALATSRPCGDGSTTEKVSRHNSSEFEGTATSVKDNDCTNSLKYGGQSAVLEDELVGCTKERHRDTRREHEETAVDETQPVPLRVSLMSTARATVGCANNLALDDVLHGSRAAKPGSRDIEIKQVVVDAPRPALKRGISIESSQEAYPVAGIVVGEQGRLRREAGRGRANPLRSDDTHEGEQEWARPPDLAMRANSGNNRNGEVPAIIRGGALSFLSTPTQDQGYFLLSPRGQTTGANLLSMFSIDSGGAAEGPAATRAEHASSEDGHQVCAVRTMGCEGYTSGENNSGEGRSDESEAEKAAPLLGGGSVRHVPGVTLSLHMLGCVERTASISSTFPSFLSPTAAAAAAAAAAADAVETTKVPGDALAECGEVPLSLLPSPLPPCRVTRVSLPSPLVEVITTGVELEEPYGVPQTHIKKERNEALGSGAREGAVMPQIRPQADGHGEKRPNVEGNANDVNFETRPLDTNNTFDNEWFGGGGQSAFGDSRTVTRSHLVSSQAKFSVAKKESEGVVVEDNNSTEVRDILPQNESTLAASSDVFAFPYVPPFAPPPPPPLPFQRVSKSPSLRLNNSSRQGVSPRLNHHHHQRQINTSNNGHTNISSTPTEGPLIAQTAASYSFISLVGSGGASHGGGSAHVGRANPSSERFLGANSLASNNYHHQHDFPHQQYLMGRRPATPSFSAATTFTAVQTSRAPVGHLTAPTSGQARSTSVISLSLLAGGGAGMVGGLYSSCAVNDANDQPDTVSTTSTLISSRGNRAGIASADRESARQHLNGQQQEHTSVGSTSTGVSGQLQSFGPGGATGGLLMRVLPVNSTDEAEGYDGRRRGRLGRRTVGRRCSNLSSTKKRRGATLPPSSNRGGTGVIERGACDHSINNVPLLPNAVRFAALFEGLPSNLMSIDSVYSGNQTAAVMIPSPEPHAQRRRENGACEHLISDSKRRQKRATSGCVGCKKVPHIGNESIAGDVENPTAIEIKGKEEAEQDICHAAGTGDGFSAIPKMLITAPPGLDNGKADNDNLFGSANSKPVVVGILGGQVSLAAIYGNEKAPHGRGENLENCFETEVGVGEEEEEYEEEYEEDECNHSSDSTDFPLGPSRGRGKGIQNQRRQTTVFYGIGGPEPLPLVDEHHFLSVVPADDRKPSDAVGDTTPTTPRPSSGPLLGQLLPSQTSSLSMLSSASAFARERLAYAANPSPLKKGQVGGDTEGGGLDLRLLVPAGCDECMPCLLKTDKKWRKQGVIGGDKAPAASKMKCPGDNERSANMTDEENEGILCQVRSFRSDDAFSMVGVGSTVTQSVGNVRFTAPLEMMGSTKEDYRNKNIIGALKGKATYPNTCKETVPHTTPDDFSPIDYRFKGVYSHLVEGNGALASTSSAGDYLDLPRPLACRVSSEAPLPLFQRGGFLNQTVGDNVYPQMEWARDSEVSKRGVAPGPDLSVGFNRASGQEFICVAVAEGNQLGSGLQGLFPPCSDSNNKAIFLEPRLIQDDATQ